MIKFGALIIALLLMSACASQQPVHYYNLHALEAPPSKTKLLADTNIGVMPVVIPSLLDRAGIVTDKKGPLVQVASHHIWGGDLQENITQVITELLANELETNQVYSGPWDRHSKPEYQAFIEIQKFSGELGKQASLKVHWYIMREFGQEKVSVETTQLKINTDSNNYSDYVSALNQLLNTFVRSNLAPALLKSIQ